MNASASAERGLRKKTLAGVYSVIRPECRKTTSAGVGEKTAVALLEKYGTLDNIYKHIDEIENRWKTKLEANKTNAYLSRDLAQIKTDLDINLDLEHAKTHDLNVPAIETFFKEMEFRTLLKTLEKVT